jgi:hypothetical protein
MHPEAHAGFGWALDQAAAALGALVLDGLRILDVGGQDINGTVYDYFPNATIDVLDLYDGPGVTIVADATTWEPDPVYDVVMCTEGFEHIADWPAVIRTMRKGLNPAGPGVLLTTVASTNRQAHGQHGAPAPAEGEHYANVEPDALREELAHSGFGMVGVRYLYPPGDAYAWALRDRVLDITVVIPTIPPRARLLTRALESAAVQTLTPAAIIVEVDDTGTGAAATRNRALERVETEWVAFLDDDDELLPDHLLTLALAQRHTGADLLWPWFTVAGGSDPFPQHRGRQWDPADPHQFPINVLVRTELLEAVGGFTTIPDGARDQDGHRTGEDWHLWLALSAAGARFHHVDAQTWTWHHHAGNTSGLPSRW